MFRGYAGAAVPRLQKLVDPKRHDLGRERPGSVGAPLLDDAHDTQGRSSEHRVSGGWQRRAEAWRQLTEKYEPRMRTRFAGQLMSNLSFSHQGRTVERITARESELATYERVSAEVLGF